MTTDSTAGPARVDFPSAGGVTVAAYRWDPTGEPRAVVQLTHGMGEHALRYAAGRRAHRAGLRRVRPGPPRARRTPPAPRPSSARSATDGWTELVDDIGRLRHRAAEPHPGLPLVLIGHSMGSFAVQQYLLDHSGDVDAVVLTGTAAIDLLEPALDLDGADGPLGVQRPVPAGSHRLRLAQPRRGAGRRLHRRPAAAGSGSTPRAPRGCSRARGRSPIPSGWRGMRKDLPVYIAVGETDPVNGELALSTPLVDRLRRPGCSDVTLRIYPGPATRCSTRPTATRWSATSSAGWTRRSRRSPVGDPLDALAQQVGVAVVAGVLADHVQIGHPQREHVLAHLEHVVERHRRHGLVGRAPLVLQPLDRAGRLLGDDVLDVVVLPEGQVVDRSDVLPRRALAEPDELRPW